MMKRQEKNNGREVKEENINHGKFREKKKR